MTATAGHGQGDAAGFAAVALPDQGLGLMVPLLPEVLDAGAAMIATAHAKAEASAAPDADAADILAGNAALAITTDPPQRAAAAACLGALARHLDSRALVAVVHRDGEVLDCTVERLDEAAEVRQRVAGLLSMAVRDVRPSVILDANRS